MFNSYETYRNIIQCQCPLRMFEHNNINSAFYKISTNNKIKHYINKTVLYI